MSFRDLREGIAELFGEWAQDDEQFSLEVYRRHQAKHAADERARVAWKMKTDPAFRERRRAQWRAQKLAAKERLTPEQKHARNVRARLRVKADPVKLAKKRAADAARRKRLGEHGRTIECACGCGAKLLERLGGRVRRYVKGHNMGQHSATRRALLALLAERAHTMRELADRLGKTITAVSSALSALRKLGLVQKPAMRSGEWSLARRAA